MEFIADFSSSDHGLDDQWKCERNKGLNPGLNNVPYDLGRTGPLTGT